MVEFDKAGAPYEVHLLSDLETLPKKKLLVFVNAFSLSDDEVSTIQRVAAENNSTVVWRIAPGMIGNDVFSFAGTCKLTGMNVRCDKSKLFSGITIPSPGSHPITKLFSASDGDKFKLDNLPTFSVSPASGVIVLGSHISNGKPAFAVRELGDYNSVYVCTPQMPTAIIHGLYQYSGVHIYCKEDDTLYANSNFIAIQTNSAGSRQIELLKAVPVYDVLDNKYISAQPVEKFEINLPDCTTKLYFLGIWPE